MKQEADGNEDKRIIKHKIWVNIDDLYAQQKWKKMDYNQTRLAVYGAIDRMKGAVLHSMREQGFKGRLQLTVYAYSKDPTRKPIEGILKVMDEAIHMRDENSTLISMSKKVEGWEGKIQEFNNGKKK